MSTKRYMELLRGMPSDMSEDDYLNALTKEKEKINNVYATLLSIEEYWEPMAGIGVKIDRYGTPIDVHAFECFKGVIEYVKTIKRLDEEQKKLRNIETT
jgi:hypothetical protein